MSENIKGKEKIKDVLCIMNLLESDMEQQKIEETYIRVIKHLHELMREIHGDMEQN